MIFKLIDMIFKALDMTLFYIYSRLFHKLQCKLIVYLVQILVWIALASDEVL